MIEDAAPAPLVNPGADRRQSLAALVHEQLRGMILDARFDLGEALSEDRIAASMGVSRTPVREALNMLQLQGLITILPQRGSFVFKPSEDDTRELCEFRMIAESQALSLALVRSYEPALAELRAAIADMETALEAHDYLACARADSRFHDAFFAHAGNAYLAEAYHLASGRISALRAHLARPAMMVRQEQVLGEHREIVEAFAGRDLVRAGALLSAHVAHMRDNYSRALREGLILVANGTLGGRRAPSRSEAANAEIDKAS